MDLPADTLDQTHGQSIRRAIVFPLTQDKSIVRIKCTKQEQLNKYILFRRRIKISIIQALFADITSLEPDGTDSARAKAKTAQFRSERREHGH